MRALMIVLGTWSAIAPAACAPRTRTHEQTAGSSAATHISTWDRELSAVAAVLHKLEPGSPRLKIGGTGPMSIRVISGATARSGDALALEVGGTCSTHASAIICSELALASILAQPSARVHPVLLFLIAHELDHLRHGEMRRFAMPELRIEARASAAEIVGVVRQSACDRPDPAEVRADDFARGAIGRAVAAGLFSRGEADVGVAAASVLLTMFEGIALLPSGGDASTAALLDNVNAASEREITDTAERVLCLIAPGQDHPVVWQGFPGGYETEGVRLTRTIEQLREELLHGGYGVAGAAGNLPQLLQAIPDVQRVMMRQNSDFVTGVAERACRQLTSQADPWDGLDCSPRAAPGPAPPRGCPVLEAHAVTPVVESRSKPATVAPISAQGDELRSTQAVTAAMVRRRGDIVLAIGDQGRLVAWGRHAPPSLLDEAGCEVGGLAEAGSDLVAVCRGGEAVVRIAAGRRRTMRLAPARVTGELDEPDRAQVSWTGAIAGRLLVAIHLVGSGRGMLAEWTADGLRSVGAWTAPGCDAVGFAARVADVGGVPWATPASTAIAPQLIQLRADLGGIVQQLQPDDARVARAWSDTAEIDPPIMTCHMSVARQVPLCAAVDGRFVDARDPLGPVLGRMADATSLASATLEVRSCGTTHADYVLVIERGARARVFALPAQGTRAEARWQVGLDVSDAERGDLICGVDTAVLTLGRGDTATVVRLGLL